ncbi:ankyrin repeat and SOCS box protein 2 isoform X4 [Lepisosteus oculatus]|uniref:ankyrin repeat and SOCS box protein 2 isoform X4 n=1 Tax=Lepisosteus oculatus TaxID=7918 RepID=UPI00371C0FE7
MFNMAVHGACVSAAFMASRISSQSVRGSTLSHEDYSLYSSLSEEELIEMAIEQSLSSSSGQQASAPEPAKNPDMANNNQQPWVQRASSNRHRQDNQHTMGISRAQNVPPPNNPPTSIGSTTKVTGKKCVTTIGSNRSNSSCNPSESERGIATQSYTFVTGNGKRCIAWRRYDGSLVVTPQVEEPDPVITAIKNGSADTLKSMIKSGKNLAGPNKDGWMPLHDAAFYGQLECIKVLLKAYPGIIDQRTLAEQTALLLAASREHLESVQFLLENGAETDIANKSRDTPLYKACERQNVDIVNLLLKFGASVNHRCNQGWTVLHEAVCRNNLAIIDLLVQAGANIESTNIYGITPLFVAAQSGQVAAVRYLINIGADVNTQASDKATALYEASKNGHTEVVELLLSYNADANKPSKDGLLPLHIASQRGHDGKKLIAFEPFPYNNEQAVKIISLLIPVTSKCRIKRSGISPLHLAAERNHDEVLELLIESGFDVNTTLSNDRSRLYEDRRSTPLYFAVSNNNINATQMLLEAGANPNIDILNPLLVAIRQGCITTIKLLLQHGANIDAYIPTHPTSFPATIMFCMKYLTLLKFLLDRGCDAEACFKCEFGSDPHPDLPTTPRDDFRLPHVPPRMVQFCEMISIPSICRWAGPIIDVLLDYVGHVKLCSKLLEHLDSYEDWAVIKEKSKPPRPLMHLCRLKIRELIGKERLKYLNTLQAPARIIRYLDHDYSTSE